MQVSWAAVAGSSLPGSAEAPISEHRGVDTHSWGSSLGWGGGVGHVAGHHLSASPFQAKIWVENRGTRPQRGSPAQSFQVYSQTGGHHQPILSFLSTSDSVTGKFLPQGWHL